MSDFIETVHFLIMSGYYLRSLPLSKSLQNISSFFPSKHPPLLVHHLSAPSTLIPSGHWKDALIMKAESCCCLPCAFWFSPILLRLEHWPCLALPSRVPLPAIDVLCCSDHTRTRYYILILLSVESLPPSPERKPCWGIDSVLWLLWCPQSLDWCLAQSSCSVKICDE